MKILAFDSTSLTASVAVCEDDKLLGQITLNNGNTIATIVPKSEDNNK